MVTDVLGIGGMERVVVTLSSGLAERGHEVSVAAEPGGALWDDLPAAVRRLPAPARATLADKVRYFRCSAGSPHSPPPR
jgi:glycine cleavage system aminomethyltransferase T